MLALLLVLAETIILSKESQFAPMFALTLGDPSSFLYQGQLQVFFMGFWNHWPSYKEFAKLCIFMLWALMLGPHYLGL